MIALRIVRYPYKCPARAAHKLYHKDRAKEQRVSKARAKAGQAGLSGYTKLQALCIVYLFQSHQVK
jgi:hypothetical protein